METITFHQAQSYMLVYSIKDGEFADRVRHLPSTVATWNRSNWADMVAAMDARLAGLEDREPDTLRIPPSPELADARKFRAWALAHFMDFFSPTEKRTTPADKAPPEKRSTPC